MPTAQVAQECIGFHKDKTLDLDEAAPIVSISLGSPGRPYILRDHILQPKTQTEIFLAHGALLQLGPETNQRYFHAVKQSVGAKPRVSVTFRRVLTFKTASGQVVGKGAAYPTLNWPVALNGQHYLDLEVPKVSRLGFCGLSSLLLVAKAFADHFGAQLGPELLGLGHQVVQKEPDARADPHLLVRCGALQVPGRPLVARHRPGGAARWPAGHGSTHPGALWRAHPQLPCLGMGSKGLVPRGDGLPNSLRAWRSSPESCCALVLLLDQFPRNAFRGTAEMFRYDSLAQEAARLALQGHLPWPHKTFCYVALMHSEDLSTVEEASLGLLRLSLEVDAPLGGASERPLRAKELEESAQVDAPRGHPASSFIGRRSACVCICVFGAHA